VYVTKLKGPLEDGWQQKVEAFASTLTSESRYQGSAAASQTVAT
jgi:hypothetical protein